MIYTYFKVEPTSPSNITKNNINRFFDFKKELKTLGDNPSKYDNIYELINKFSKELRQNIPKLTDISANDIE